MAQARTQIESLIADSVEVIGSKQAESFLNIENNAAFFTSVIRYAVLNDHAQRESYSPDLSEILLSGRVPSCTKDFVGRKKELSLSLIHI